MVKAAIVVVLLGAVAVAAGWGVARAVAQPAEVAASEREEPVGRYQVAVPDLVLDTATGKLVGGNGQVLEPPIDPSGTEVGRYTVDGYVTSVTRSVGLDVIQVPVARVDLVKGYVLGDSKTGRIIKSRVYLSRPIQPGDL